LIEVGAELSNLTVHGYDSLDAIYRWALGRRLVIGM
jgi:hypothetical protein